MEEARQPLEGKNYNYSPESGVKLPGRQPLLKNLQSPVVSISLIFLFLRLFQKSSDEQIFSTQVLLSVFQILPFLVRSTDFFFKMMCLFCLVAQNPWIKIT